MEYKNRKKRYYELDFARAFPLLGLPFVHCYEELVGVYITGNVETWGKIWLYLCMIGPSVFMMCLGMNISFSKHNTPKQLLTRGIQTIVFFFLLGFFRGIMPAIVAESVGVVGVLKEEIEWFFISDILFFAGLSFIFFAVVKKLKIQPFYVFIFSIVSLTINMAIPKIDTGSMILNGIIGNFVYVDEFSCFPIASWIIFPATGYFFASYFKKLDSEKMLDRFYLRLFLLCVCVFASISVCLYSYGLNPLLIAASPANNYVTDLFNVALDICASFAWISIAYFIFSRLKFRRIKSFFILVSRAILIFYFVQWILVGWTAYIFEIYNLKHAKVYGDIIYIIISICIFIASLVIALWIQKLMDQRRSKIK